VSLKTLLGDCGRLLYGLGYFGLADWLDVLSRLGVSSRGVYVDMES